MKLDNFRLLVNDFAASLQFWQEVIGLRLIFKDDTNTYAYFDAGHVRLELLNAGYFAASFGGEAPAPSNQRGVIVFGTEDIEATYNELLERGATSLAAPHVQAAGFAKVALFSAPDGYIVEIFQSLNRKTFA